MNKTKASPAAEDEAGKEAANDQPAGGGSSAERSLRLLALLAQQGRALSLAEMAVLIGLPKATVHRLSSQLLESGYLARDVDERQFIVGPALRQLAFDTLNHSVARGLRHDVLDALVKEVGETCNFTTFDGTQVLYLDRVEPQATIFPSQAIPLKLEVLANQGLSLKRRLRRSRQIPPSPAFACTQTGTPDCVSSTVFLWVPNGTSQRPEDQVREAARQGIFARRWGGPLPSRTAHRQSVGLPLSEQH